MRLCVSRLVEFQCAVIRSAGRRRTFSSAGISKAEPEQAAIAPPPALPVNAHSHKSTVATDHSPFVTHPPLVNTKLARPCSLYLYHLVLLRLVHTLSESPLYTVSIPHAPALANPSPSGTYSHCPPPDPVTLSAPPQNVSPYCVCICAALSHIAR